MGIWAKNRQGEGEWKRDRRRRKRVWMKGRNEDQRPYPTKKSCAVPFGLGS